jgi:UDP-N-acetylglucosamine acyltransferase
MIHSTAIVETNNIGKDVLIGAYSYIASNVILNDNCKIYNHTSVGVPPVYALRMGTKPNLEIVFDEGVEVREMCFISAPVEYCMFLGAGSILCQASSITHDVSLGKGVIINSGARVAGFSYIGDYSVLGMNSVVHQKYVFPAYSFLGANSLFKSTVSVPGLIWAGCPAKPVKVNIIGLERNIEDKILREEIIENATNYLRCINKI